MDHRGIQKVRQSIKQRKKQRESQELQTKRVLPLVTSDEEKHGFEQPVYQVEPTFTKGKPAHFMNQRMFLKIILAFGLFIITNVIFKVNSPTLEPIQQLLNRALVDEFPFARVHDWYVTTFGTPLAFTPQGNISLENENSERQLSLPVIGQVAETFAMTGTGIMIAPEMNTNIVSIDRGVVIFAGNDKTTGKTITVQHGDGSETTYGFLSSIDVHLYQFVGANQVLGTFQPTEENEVVYFSIEKDQQFIDPLQVIPVGDIP